MPTVFGMAVREKTKRIRRFLLDAVEDHPEDLAAFAAERLGISRQAVNRHIHALVEEDLLEFEGATRARVYRLKSTVHESVTLEVSEHPHEDQVWRTYIAPHLQDFTSNVRDICQYGFNEMYNNVVDHSEAETVTIGIERTATEVRLTVFDLGVGIFRKIAQALNLQEERFAILELSKGKLTTDPEHHTGEGIFFTSRLFDEFIMLSSQLYLSAKDGSTWVIENADPKPGTLVKMSIGLSSTRTVKSVFDKFSSGPEDYAFSKTHVPVRLAVYGTEKLVSRSQAKRVLARFDSFREVLLDFTGVEQIGQPFADEIFRVFKNEHPDIEVVGIHMEPDVEKMVRRAQAALRPSQPSLFANELPTGESDDGVSD